MNRQQRAHWIDQKLNSLYPQTDVPLDHQDPYTLLVAVVLSAQCTDKMVNRVTPNLWKLAKTPKAMAKVPVEKIQEVIRPCGLSPRKSKAIQELSAILVEKHQSQVPTSLEALESLPGVGHKTASVVLVQAFGIPAFPVDTHIHRLAQRWKLTNGPRVEHTEQDLKKLYPPESRGRLHLQIMFYGREHCTARGCDGTRCEICSTLFPKRKGPYEVHPQ
ncbi:MAG: endonuclease III [Pirellulaceae bacterium]